MGAYILRRLLLVIPTLLGIMIVNFALVQFVPGGPIDTILARMDGGGDAFEGIAGGANDVETEEAGDSAYPGAIGISAERLAQLAAHAAADHTPVEFFHGAALRTLWIAGSRG